jgi:enterochelin esterase-like enzyme
MSSRLDLFPVYSHKLLTPPRLLGLSIAGLFLVLLTSAVFVCLHGGIKRGNLETVEYDFGSALGGKQRIAVYLPPNYPSDAPYPVLYLLHGGGDDETSWQKEGGAVSILEQLFAEKRLVPMIVVMPTAQGRGTFEQDLLDTIIPCIESRYPTRRDGRHSAIAGVSLGGWQALYIGLKHTDRFAWVGGFSPSLVSDVLPDSYRGQLMLLWLSWADKDSVSDGCEILHRMLQEKDVPHEWRVNPGEHEWRVWRNDLRRFLPLLFRDESTAGHADRRQP